jgi:hypothetical protein
LAEATEALSEAEAARLVEAAAAEALRTRLEEADAELTSLTLALEEQRREAEETLTLLAAADAARTTWPPGSPPRWRRWRRAARWRNNWPPRSWKRNG